MRLCEGNYSYSMIAKKLGRSEAWVSKWARLWKMNQAEFLQSQSRRRLTNETALNLTAQRIIRKSKYQTGHSLREIEKEVKGKQLSRCRESIQQLKMFGALRLQMFMPAQSHKH